MKRGSSLASYVLAATSKAILANQIFVLNDVGQEAMEHMKVLLIIQLASLALLEPMLLPQELLSAMAVLAVNFR